MKKIYTLGLMAAFTGVAIAQPTLTESNSAPIIGETFVMGMVEWDGTPPTSGADQTWDYSGLTSTGPFTTDYLALEDCEEYESFPEATIGSTSDGGTSFGFNDYNSTANLNYGYYAAGAVIEYSDPEQQLAYPFTYEDSFEDDFSASFVSGGLPLDRAGTATVTAIGYGTLILPTGTVNNVLLTKLEQDYGDSYEGTEISHYNTEIYQFMLPGVHYPVLGFTSLIVSGGEPSFSGQFSSDESLALDEAITTTLNIYPNPVIDNLNIQLDAETAASIESIEIYNLTGSLVYATDKNMTSINTSALTPGMYYIKLNTAEEQIVRKFVKS